MKKLLLLFLFIFAFVLPVNAFNPLLVCTGAVASASCDTEKDTETGTESNTFIAFRYTTTDWVATKFTAGSTYTVCKIGMYMLRTETPASFNITACIYSDDGGVGDAADPDSLVGTCSDTVAESTIGTSTGEIAHTNVSADLTSGTSYWVVVYSDAVDSDNYARVSLTNTGAVELFKKSGDGSSWTTEKNYNTLRYKLYE